MGDDPPVRSRSVRVRVALWVGFVIALMPVVLGMSGENAGSTERTLALHLLLAFPLFLALAAAWYRPRVGAAVYFVLGAAYAGGLVPGMGIVWSLVLVTPLFLVTALLMERPDGGHDDA